MIPRAVTLLRRVGGCVFGFVVEEVTAAGGAAKKVAGDAGK